MHDVQKNPEVELGLASRQRPSDDEPVAQRGMFLLILKTHTAGGRAGRRRGSEPSGGSRSSSQAGGQAAGCTRD